MTIFIAALDIVLDLVTVLVAFLLVMNSKTVHEVMVNFTVMAIMA